MPDDTTKRRTSIAPAEWTSIRTPYDAVGRPFATIDCVDVEEVCERSGIQEEITPHAFTITTAMLRAGANLRHVHERSVAMRKSDLELTITELKEAHQKSDPRDCRTVDSAASDWYLGAVPRTPWKPGLQPSTRLCSSSPGGEATTWSRSCSRPQVRWA